MKEIKLQATETLLDELATRFDSIAFIGKKANVKSKGDNRYVHFFQGQPVTLFGMCDFLKDIVREEADKEAMNNDGE